MRKHIVKSLWQVLKQLQIEQHGLLIEENVKVADELSMYKLIGIDFNVDYIQQCLACVYGDGTVHYYDEIRQQN
jgi:hypothetical protein